MVTKSQMGFKEFFMIEFTKEIIRSTEIYKEHLIKEEVKEVISFHNQNKKPVQKVEKRLEIKKIIQEKIKEESARIKNLKKGESLQEFKFPNEFKIKENKHQPFSVPRLRIPEPKLPQTVKDIRPSFSSRELHLEKLNVLVKDPLVKTIECPGPGEKIIVTGAMGRKNTGIILTEEEIEQTIEKFSQSTRIPATEGIFKVVFGRLSLSAIVSEFSSPKFIIKKLAPPPLEIPLPRR